MTTRRPLVLISGAFSELPQGDSTVGATVGIAANPSGLIFVGSDLGIDGLAIASGEAAQGTANTALASGNAAQLTANTAIASGNTAQASGNAALSLAATKLGEDDVISLIVGLS